MSINKQPIYPHLVRRVPDQFSWIDHRLVREQYIDHISPGAAALYLFLVTVSDSQGMSYYSDQTLQKRIGLGDVSLETVRQELVTQRLVGWLRPLYQILPLDHRRVDHD